MESLSSYSYAQNTPLGEVYDELRNLAYHYLCRERKGHTLQPTALVHEVVLKLQNHKALHHVDRNQFIGLAAKAMRQILVDHARRRKAFKRGGSHQRIPMDEVLAEYQERSIDVIALHEALENLASIDPRMVQIVELRFFAGMDEKQIASMLNISPSTVRREWRHARHWLFHQLRDRI